MLCSSDLKCCNTGVCGDGVFDTSGSEEWDDGNTLPISNWIQLLKLAQIISNLIDFKRKISNLTFTLKSLFSKIYFQY